MLKRIYVWEFPVRLSHWVNFLAIVILSFTGYYVGHPFFNAPPGEVFYMSFVRAVHFATAYIFTVSFLVRIYWAFVGNEYSRWNIFFPFVGPRRKDLIGCIQYYLFWRVECPPAAGHSASAALSYLILFVLYAVEIITGFALLSQSHPPSFFWTVMGGWSLHLAAAPMLRLVHHLIMWAIIIFAVIHVYIGWLNDLAERKFVMSSIFGGYKADEK
jgi:Ni/Fe-hydrogenase 1 B-type cytochrome subunit